MSENEEQAEEFPSMLSEDVKEFLRVLHTWPSEERTAQGEEKMAKAFGESAEQVAALSLEEYRLRQQAIHAARSLSKSFRTPGSVPGTISAPLTAVFLLGISTPDEVLTQLVRLMPELAPLLAP